MAPSAHAIGALPYLERRLRLLSADHFTVDGTLLESWASMKSLRPREGDDDLPRDSGKNPTVDFRGERRSNPTHVSTTDPEARLARKGPGWETRLAFAGHVLMENWTGLVVDVTITQATGLADPPGRNAGSYRAPG